MKLCELFENHSGYTPSNALVEYFKSQPIDLDEWSEAFDLWEMYVEDFLGFESVEDVDYADHSVDFARFLRDRGYVRHFRNVYGSEVPAWMWLDFKRVLPGDTWMIHFTEHPKEITQQGFTKGVSLEDLDTSLAFTWENGQRSYKHTGMGYNFGLLALDEKTLGEVAWMHGNGDGYGRHAVLFQASGILAYHEGDKHDQTIFWGPSAKNFIPLTNRDSGWWTGGGRKSTYLPALVKMILG